MNKRNLIENNLCPVSYEKMPVAGTNRFCKQCVHHLPDLSALSIAELAQDHYGKNKCVALASDQLAFILSIKNLKKITIAASLFIGTTFCSLSYGQNIEEHLQHPDSCLVSGVLVKGNKQAWVNKRIYVYVKDSDVVYETRTNSKGEFALNLPKNAQISSSNIAKLESKKTRNRNTIKLGSIKFYITRPMAPGFF